MLEHEDQVDGIKSAANAKKEEDVRTKTSLGKKTVFSFKEEKKQCNTKRSEAREDSPHDVSR